MNIFQFYVKIRFVPDHYIVISGRSSQEEINNLMNSFIESMERSVPWRYTDRSTGGQVIISAKRMQEADIVLEVKECE